MAEKHQIGIAYYVYRAHDDVERIKGEIPFVIGINGIDGNLEIAVQEGAEGLPDVALVRDVIKNCSNGEGILCCGGTLSRQRQYCSSFRVE